MNVRDFLRRQVDAFQDFSDERLKQLVDGSRVVSFEANEPVAQKGAEALHFGVVLSGIVTASIAAEGVKREFLGRLKAGDTFGEMALMTGKAVLADLLAESRCQVLLIPVSLFQSVIVAEPRAAQCVSRSIARRLEMLPAGPSKAAATHVQNTDSCCLELKGERPEKILVINCGSSSLKYSFYDTADRSRDARGLVERIGIDGTRLVHRGPQGEVRRNLPQGAF